MKKLLIWGIASLVALNTGVFAASETVKLGYQLETGAHYQYQMTVKTETVQLIREQKVRRSEVWQVGYRITVLSGSNNRSGILLRVTYDTIGHQFSSPFQQYAYELGSNPEELPQTLQPYAALIGTDFNLKLNKRPLIQLPDFQPKGPALDFQQLFALLSPEGQTANRIFPYLVQNIYPILPNSQKPLKCQDRWQNQFTVHNGRVAVKMNAEYQLADTGGDRVRVELTAPSGCSFKQKLTYKNHKKMVVQAVADLAGTAQGHFEMAKTDSLPLRGAIKVELAGEVRKIGVIIPTTLQTEVSYRLVDQL